jgi:hypothetical protein
MSVDDDIPERGMPSTLVWVSSTNAAWMQFFACPMHKRAIDLRKLENIIVLRGVDRVILRASLAFVLTAGLMTVPAMASRVHRAPTSGHAHKSKAPTVAKTKKLHGQQAIDSERVTAIQQALIREHYLSGDPSSKWDGDTQAAMLKFQSDQGWQTKLTPDSRALIKLGLGPNHSAAINGGSGTSFNTLNSTPLSMQPQGFVEGSGVR